MLIFKYNRAVVFAAALTLGGSFASAAAVEFDLKDPKGVHNISFVLDSQIEPIMGLAAGISGSMKFDPADPARMTGKIVIQADSLHFENQGMEKTLHKPDWIDVKQFPTIEFTFKSVKDAKKPGENRHDLSVVGDFTCRGVTRELTVPVTITYLPDMLEKRMQGAKGDLLVMRSEFSIKRTDFGIKPDMGDMVVADEIQIRAAIVGTCAR